MTVKIGNKGYTITVVSWENDGDNYNTKSIIVDTIDKARDYYELMQLCVSENNRPGMEFRLGNTYDGFNKDQIQLIVDFFKSHPNICGDNVFEDDDEYVDFFYELSYDLLGGSEYYVCRVMENCIVTFLEEDVYAEKIEFPS